MRNGKRVVVDLVMNRKVVAAVLSITCALSARAQENQAMQRSLSPDKKWEYMGGETAKLVNASTE